MIDLHMHSKYSDDGEYTPTELVEQCFAQGICMMSVTDHNCAKANEEAQIAAKKKGITYIPGIEIDCFYEDINFHMLGYQIDFQSKDFEWIETNIEKQSFQASLEMLGEIQALGFNVTENDMWNISKNCYRPGAWTGEMFAEVLLAKPEYVDHPLLQPYRPDGLRSDNPYMNFYWDFFSQGKICYVKIEYPGMEDVIDIIHRNHGMAVLAHPGVNLKNNNHLLDKILDLGIDGIEVFSSYHTLMQVEYFYKKTTDRQLLFTCGSDYHGKTKPSIKIGQHKCLISNKELFNQLERIFKSSRE